MNFIKSIFFQKTLKSTLYKWLLILAILPQLASIIIVSLFTSEKIKNRNLIRVETLTHLYKGIITSEFFNLENALRDGVTDPNKKDYDNIRIFSSDSIIISKHSREVDTLTMNDIVPEVAENVKRTMVDCQRRFVIDCKDSLTTISYIVPMFSTKEVISIQKSFASFDGWLQKDKLASYDFVKTAIFHDKKLFYTNDPQKGVDSYLLLQNLDTIPKKGRVTFEGLNKTHNVIVSSDVLTLSNLNLSIINYVDYKYIYQSLKKSVLIYLFIFFTLVFVVILVAKKIGNRMSYQITKISLGIKEILNSNYKDIKQPIIQFKELEVIWDSISNIIDKDLKIRAVAQKASNGDFSSKIENYNENDITAMSINTMIDYFTEVIDISKKITKEDFDVEISDNGELNSALSSMAKQLKYNTTKLKNSNWIYDGDSYLSNILLEQNDIDQLCRKVIVNLGIYTSVANGVFLLQEQDKLSIISSYNIKFDNPQKTTDKDYSFLKEYFPDLMEKIITIEESHEFAQKMEIDSFEDKYILIQPISLNNDLLGCIILTDKVKFEPTIINLLDLLSLKIALSISITLNMIRIQGQLQQSTIDNQTIKRQKEEMGLLFTALEDKTILLEEEFDRAERANKIKSDFIANMSHEIRTPMNSIIGFAELLKDNITDSLSIKYINSIQNSSNILLELINDILDLSKIEANKIEIHKTMTNLNSLIISVINLFEPHIAKKKISVSFDNENLDLVDFNIDEIRVRQIITNIISNAIKFTDVGGISVVVKSTLVNSLYSISVSITDSGIGIEKEQQEKIFESFVQKDGQSTKKYGGTGLGLSISKKLAELMDGELTLESEIGIGTTFTLKINNIEYSKSSVITEQETPILIKKTDLNKNDYNLSSNYKKLLKQEIDIELKSLSNAFDFDIFDIIIEKLEIFANKYELYEIIDLTTNLKDLKEQFSIIEIEETLKNLEESLNEK